MDSYLESQFPHHHNHHQNQQPNSGLLRFRSAPSSLLNELTQTPMTDPDDEFAESSYERKPLTMNSRNGYSGSGSGSGQLPPQYPKQHMGTATSSSIQRSNSLEIDQPMVQGTCDGGVLNLTRRSSSPAGFFHQLNPQNGYSITRVLGNFTVANGTNGESNPRLSRLSMSNLPQIPEAANENIKETSLDDLNKFRNHGEDSGFDSPNGFPFASWNGLSLDSPHLSESGGLASRPNSLTHHLSLPKTSAEMAAVEKLMQFPDSIPCRVRAKRGCATHPRSIAERVRRNRISERMRKLQELVPNMDKQTNTADMLDLAVEYIKNLQKQHKVLLDNRAKCKCVNL